MSLLLCADNLLSDLQYPLHTVSAQESAAGYGVDRVANGRRHAADRWEPTTANADRYVRVLADVQRAADFVAIDRASNHLGYRYQLQTSDDGFATSSTLWDINPLPTVAGGLPAGGAGCVTSEGAWLKTATAEAAHGWQLVSKAMGAGLKPQLAGVWIGKAWRPAQSIVRFPLEDRSVAVTYESTVSPYGWAGRGQVARVRTGTLNLGFADEADEIGFARHVETLFVAGWPMWLAWQVGSAPWRALLVRFPEGADLRPVVDPSWHGVYRSVSVPFVEEQPA